MMPQYHIGTLDNASIAALSSDDSARAPDASINAVFLQPKSWVKATLSAKRTVSWDTRIFTFALASPEQSLGLPTGQHLMIRLRDPVTREAIIRSYTPISHESTKGHVDVLVKVYFPSSDGKSAGGKMSLALESIPVGHSIDFKGPIGKFEYLERGRCTVNGKERKVKSFVMICGGSGVTPVYQVFRRVMQDQEDNTHCTLLDGNRLVEDILVKDDLDKHAEGNDHKCKLVYTLTKPNEEWQGLKGRIGEDLLKEHAHPELEHLKAASEEEVGGRMALICGPEAMETTVRGILTDLGWKSEELLFF
jgi:nitrate reductase (NAD(P)H)